MKQLFAYIRVSDPKQGKGVSLDEQRSIIEGYATRIGAVIVEWFVETRTAAKAGRPVFDRMVKDRRVRPTALEPVWRVAGFALGAATALMGEKAAMACTVAVEDVIDEHYQNQIERLGKTDPELKGAISRFREDECAHRDEALAHGAAEAPAYPLLAAAIRLSCRIAIGLSERI